MNIIPKTFPDIMSWIASFILIAGGYLTSVNIYPLNNILLFIGSILFAYVGVAWNKSSMWALNLLMVVIYGRGLFLEFF